MMMWVDNHHVLQHQLQHVYLSYFLLVDVLVFVLVDERLIWYSCMYLVMSLLQHLFVPLSRIIFSIRKKNHSNSKKYLPAKYDRREPVEGIIGA